MLAPPVTTHQAAADMGNGQHPGALESLLRALPGWVLPAVVGGAILLGWAHGTGSRRMKAKGQHERPGANGAVDAVGEGIAALIGGTFALLWRLLSGHPLRRSTGPDGKPLPAGPRPGGATFWKAGAAPVAAPTAPAAQLASIAVPAPAVSLRKRPPRQWPARLAKGADTAVQRLAGTGPRAARTVDVLMPCALWAARVAGRAYRVARAVGRATVLVGRAMVPVATALGHARRTYGHWAGWAVALVRVVPLTAVGAWFLLPASRPWIVFVVLVLPAVVIAAAATGPAGLAWWRLPEPSWDRVHGANLWRAMSSHLRLPDGTQQHMWLALPDDPDKDGAEILLHLPPEFTGTATDRAALTELLHATVPGEWRATWALHARQDGTPRHVRWAPQRYGTGDAATYGPALWTAFRQVLRLSADDQERGPEHWISLPEALESDAACITIRLPLGWLGSDAEKGLMTQVLHQRVPGEWVPEWQFLGEKPYVRWTPKPPPAPKPELPKTVEWIPSDNPDRVMIGVTHEGVRYIDTAGETPHWGVSGGTGNGKTTVLLMPVVHGRQHGTLVDCITMKSKAFHEIEGGSGIRVHKSGRKAVAAMAEFYISMKAAEDLQGTTEGDRLPGRILVIDEFASFVKSAKIWWKYGLQAKGMPPFEAWFHMILMQGRSSNHKIVIGAHTFTRELFGDTETRDLVGTKAIVGPASNPKWMVTYGDAPRVPYESSIKGRGVVGITGVPEVEEIQFAYITPIARQEIDKCAPAPEWFTNGEIAPWVTDAALTEAEEELAIADFLPGGAYMKGVTLVTSRTTSGAGVPSPRSEHVTDAAGTPGVTGDVTGGVTLDKGTAAGDDDELAPECEQVKFPTYSLREACEEGIIPVKYDAARQRMTRARKKGITEPEGVTVDGTTYYTKAELKDWWKLIEVAGKRKLGA